MDKKSRLNEAFQLVKPDRPPILGGWLAAPAHICTLTGCTEDEYWQNPMVWAVEAERVLDSDGLVTTVKPARRGDFRIIDAQTLENRSRYTLETVLKEIASLPTPEEQRAQFNENQEYASIKIDYLSMQERCGEMLWCEADWDVIPRALWYDQYGYENALTLPLVDPEAHLKLMRHKAENARQRAILQARLIQEGHRPPAILTGEDLCSQRGPMINPQYLRKDYFTLLEYAIEPLLNVGAKLVWHCDGDVRPILQDVLACGFAGLQGFQDECGMELDWIVDLKTRHGDPLLIFGPISVTRTLPFSTPQEVRQSVQKAMDLCKNKASLVFFTSNTINPDVPLENLLAYWDEVKQSCW